MAQLKHIHPHLVGVLILSTSVELVYDVIKSTNLSINIAENQQTVLETLFIVLHAFLIVYLFYHKVIRFFFNFHDYCIKIKTRWLYSEVCFIWFLQSFRNLYNL